MSLFHTRFGTAPRLFIEFAASGLLGLLLLTGCNLQPVAPTPTVASTALPPEISTATPIQPTVAPLPLLQPTLPLPSLPAATQPNALVAPTLAVLGRAVPTLNAAAAAYRYEVKTRPNQTLRLHYNVEMTSGAVSLVMQGPDGLVWQKTFTSAEASQTDVPLNNGGVYEILVFAERFDGSYSVWWE